jgi:tRNA threonylcarbamoyladenosine biosynthesis protein TsaE
MELSYKLEELPRVVDTVLKQLNSKLVCFYGDMGAGKTTFIKAMVKALGNDDVVSSPTFSLVNPYVTGKDTIYHFDLYRVQDVEELYQIGIEDYLDSDAWILIEWPQIIADLLPETHSSLYFSTVNNDVRSLKLTENYCLT